MMNFKKTETDHRGELCNTSVGVTTLWGVTPFWGLPLTADIKRFNLRNEIIFNVSYIIKFSLSV